MNIILQYLYIPIWLYSNFESEGLRIIACNLYIPIWLYSNAKYLHTTPGYLTLHSNLVIFKCCVDIVCTKAISLYIPIWLYSNCYNCSRNINNMHFTFQSGYIQITTGRLWPHSTQALHSNLVIFKLRMLAITRELSTFTFQSGYIQMRNIQRSLKRFRLYIPIWLYSNFSNKNLPLFAFPFTFQSGYIQMTRPELLPVV